jgi:hypothetical protein
LCHQTTLLAGVREHPAQRLPDPQRTVSHRQHGCGHTTAPAAAQQISPRFGGVTVTVSEGDQLFAAVGAHPDHHQQAQLLLIQPHLQMNPVDPQVHVVDAGQIPLLK